MVTRVGPLGLEIVRITASGRRRYSEASKARLVDACLDPATSLAGLARQHDVNANLLRKWVKGRIDGTSPSGACAPVMMKDAGAFVRVETSDLHTAAHAGRLPPPTMAGASSARLSAEMPNGVRLALEGRDPQMLAVMIDALGRV